jgi:hypothetical protein
LLLSLFANACRSLVVDLARSHQQTGQLGASQL